MIISTISTSCCHGNNYFARLWPRRLQVIIEQRNPTTGMASCKMYREVLVLNAVILCFFNNNLPLKCSENERRNDILVVYYFTSSSEAEFMNVQFR